jgi:hypothetical protein
MGEGYHRLWDVIAMRGELEQMLGRKVDLVEKDAIRNPFRRREILRTHQVSMQQPEERDAAYLWDMEVVADDLPWLAQSLERLISLE